MLDYVQGFTQNFVILLQAAVFQASLIEQVEHSPVQVCESDQFLSRLLIQLLTVALISTNFGSVESKLQCDLHSPDCLQPAYDHLLLRITELVQRLCKTPVFCDLTTKFCCAQWQDKHKQSALMYWIVLIGLLLTRCFRIQLGIVFGRRNSGSGSYLGLEVVDI